MRKYFLLTALFALMSLCCNAQFKLTPSAGLMTEDGPYTITKSGSEVENYEAAKKAVENYLSQNGVLTDVYLSEKLPEANPVSGKFKLIIAK